MTTEAELLHAIVSDLDDRDGWQVYLDWLLEREDPRAELVRLQVALEDADDEREKKVLSTRITALVDAHEDSWLAAVRARKLPVRFGMHRGVVGRVSGTPAQLAAHAAQILEAAPLLMAVQVMVNKTERDRDLSPLAGSPLLARVRELEIYGETTKRVTGWQHLIAPELRSLAMATLAFAPEDLAAVVAVPRTALERLRFTWCRFNKGAIAPLATLNAPKLARFDLSAGHLGGGIGAVVAAFPPMTYLRIPGNEMGSEALASIRPVLGQVTYLDLRSNELVGTDVAPLLAAIPKVTVLKLGGNELGTEAVEQLATWPGLAQLRWLDVGHASERGAQALASSEQFSPALSRLNLGTKRLELTAEHALLDAPRLANARIYVGGKLLARKKREAERAKAAKQRTR